MSYYICQLKNNEDSGLEINILNVFDTLTNATIGMKNMMVNKVMREYGKKNEEYAKVNSYNDIVENKNYGCFYIESEVNDNLVITVYEKSVNIKPGFFWDGKQDDIKEIYKLKIAYYSNFQDDNYTKKSEEVAVVKPTISYINHNDVMNELKNFMISNLKSRRKCVSDSSIEGTYSLDTESYDWESTTEEYGNYEEDEDITTDYFSEF